MGYTFDPSTWPISWKQMVSNQVFVVPGRVLAEVKAYAKNRGALVQQIEQEDVRQLKEQKPEERSRK
jgi:hypothetical protein